MGPMEFHAASHLGADNTHLRMGYFCLAVAHLHDMNILREPSDLAEDTAAHAVIKVVTAPMLTLVAMHLHCFYFLLEN